MRIYIVIALILSLGTAVFAEKDKDKVKVVTCGGVKPLEARSAIEARVGQPILADPINHIFHYANSLIIIVDPYDRVINVHGPQIELDGKAADFTTRDELEKKLGKGTEVVDKEGTSTTPEDKDKDKAQKEKHLSRLYHLVFSKWGLTAYLHGDDITGYLMEPTR